MSGVFLTNFEQRSYYFFFIFSYTFAIIIADVNIAIVFTCIAVTLHWRIYNVCIIIYTVWLRKSSRTPWSLWDPSTLKGVWWKLFRKNKRLSLFCLRDTRTKATALQGLQDALGLIDVRGGLMGEISSSKEEGFSSSSVSSETSESELDDFVKKKRKLNSGALTSGWIMFDAQVLNTYSF